MTKEDAVKEIYFWQYSNTGCFNQKLFDLYMKADGNNKSRLWLAFPELIEALEDWNKAGDYGKELFIKYGLIKD